MKRILLLALVGVVVVIALVSIVTSTRKSSAQQALNDYKAKLRAQGEKLSWAELGYPRPIESNDCLTRIVQAVGQIGGGKLTPGFIKLMDVSVPTNIQTAWAKPDLELQDKTTTNLSWEIVSQELAAVAAPLAEIRAALSNPPARLLTDPTNPYAYPAFHAFQLVEQRNAALWLSAEIIIALHQGKLDLVREDLQALLQLVHLHEDDPALVSQMIRVGFVGLALTDTWEALQTTGWREDDLAVLQADWEQINLFRNLVAGILGERLTSEALFDRLKNLSASAQVQQWNTSFGGSTSKSLKYYWQVFVTTPIWQINRETDELFALRHLQNSIESVRRLNHGTNWVVVRQELADNKAEFDKTMDGPFAAIRHSLSAILIPNTERATLAAVRNETRRRLTVVAIALKRYELKNRQPPSSLEALVPDFIAKIPIDPMSGKSLCYRTNQTGYVLYSMGEDGVDDGGDARAATPTGKNDLWSSRDAVWPTVTSNNP